jgi:hypothetical protein
MLRAAAGAHPMGPTLAGDQSLLLMCTTGLGNPAAAAGFSMPAAAADSSSFHQKPANLIKAETILPRATWSCVSE